MRISSEEDRTSRAFLVTMTTGFSVRVAVAVAVSALAMAGVVLAERYSCQAPMSEYDCSRIRVKCTAVEKGPCEEAGGAYLPRAGFCGYCDLCAVYVEEFGACNSTDWSNTAVPKTAVCTSAYVCTSSRDGQCVVPQSCDYPPEKKQ